MFIDTKTWDKKKKEDDEVDDDDERKEKEKKIQHLISGFLQEGLASQVHL